MKPFVFLLQLLIAIGSQLFISCQSSKVVSSSQEYWPLHIIDSTLYGADGIRVGDFNGDDRGDFISGGEEKGETRIYLPTSDRGYETISFESPDVEDAIFIDADGNGQPEVMTLCEGKNQGIDWHFKNGQGQWISKRIKSSSGIQWMYACPIELSAHQSTMVVGSKGEGGILAWLSMDHPYILSTDWALHTIGKVSWIMSIVILDLDGDGDQDILVTDRKGEESGVKWFENPGTALWHKPWPEHVLGLAGKEVMFMEVLDYDFDGDQDIVVADIAEGVFLLRNSGKLKQTWPTQKLFSYPEGVGNRGKSVALMPTSDSLAYEIYTSFEEAEGKVGVLQSKPLKGKKWQHRDISGPLGIKYDKLLLYDVDGDGDMDIMTTEERANKNGLGVIWYENPE